MCQICLQILLSSKPTLTSLTCKTNTDQCLCRREAWMRTIPSPTVLCLHQTAHRTKALGPLPSDASLDGCETWRVCDLSFLGPCSEVLRCEHYGWHYMLWCQKVGHAFIRNWVQGKRKGWGVRGVSQQLMCLPYKHRDTRSFCPRDLSRIRGTRNGGAS